MVFPRLWLLGMARQAYVTGPVMFSLVVCGLHGGMSLLLVSSPSVVLDGTQDQARPSLNSTRLPGEGACRCRGSALEAGALPGKDTCCVLGMGCSSWFWGRGSKPILLAHVMTAGS